MNILVFSWRDPKHPLAGGAEQVMHEHMKGWIDAGHSVTLFTSFFNGGKREENIDGVKILRRGVQLLGVQVLGALWYLFGEHSRFDLVVDQFHGIPFFTPLYVRPQKLAVIQEVAKEVWLMNHLPKPFNWIVGYLGYFLEPFIFLFYKQSLLPGRRGVPFMVGSNSAKEDVVKFGINPKNITIVPHGVIVPKGQILNVKQQTKTIVYLGALTKDKGVEDAIKSFSILSQKDNFNFWVIGRGSKVYIEELNKTAARLSVQDKIKFWGFVDQKKKFKLLSGAHLLINPSVREGWGLVNIEANAAGTPVVAYNSPGLTDSVKEGVSGIICKENSPEALSIEILSLLSNDKKYEQMRKSAVAWAKSFSWEKSRRQSLVLVDSVVHSEYSFNK